MKLVAAIEGLYALRATPKERVSTGASRFCRKSKDAPDAVLAGSLTLETIFHLESDKTKIPKGSGQQLALKTNVLYIRVTSLC